MHNIIQDYNGRFSLIKTRNKKKSKVTPEANITDESVMLDVIVDIFNNEIFQVNSTFIRIQLFQNKDFGILEVFMLDKE